MEENGKNSRIPGKIKPTKLWILASALNPVLSGMRSEIMKCLPVPTKDIGKQDKDYSSQMSANEEDVKQFRLSEHC